MHDDGGQATDTLSLPQPVLPERHLPPLAARLILCVVLPNAVHVAQPALRHNHNGTHSLITWRCQVAEGDAGLSAPAPPAVEQIPPPSTDSFRTNSLHSGEVLEHLSHHVVVEAVDGGRWYHVSPGTLAPLVTPRLHFVLR